VYPSLKGSQLAAVVAVAPACSNPPFTVSSAEVAACAKAGRKKTEAIGANIMAESAMYDANDFFILIRF
jgi:hypothetical protein